MSCTNKSYPPKPSKEPGTQISGGLQRWGILFEESMYFKQIIQLTQCIIFLSEFYIAHLIKERFLHSILIFLSL